MIAFRHCIHVGTDDPDHLDGRITAEHLGADTFPEAVEVGGTGGHQHGARGAPALHHQVTCLHERAAQQRISRAAEESGCAGRPQLVPAGRRVHREVAVGRETEIVDDGQRHPLADASLHHDIKDVSVEDNHMRRGAGADRRAGTLRAGAGHLEGGVAAIEHPLDAVAALDYLLETRIPA